jgi:hypothetical protein
MSRGRVGSEYAHDKAVRYLRHALEPVPDTSHVEYSAVLLVRARAYHWQACRDPQCHDLTDMTDLAAILQNEWLEAPPVASRQSNYGRTTGNCAAAIEAARATIKLALAPEYERLNQDAYRELAGHMH